MEKLLLPVMFEYTDEFCRHDIAGSTIIIMNSVQERLSRSWSVCDEFDITIDMEVPRPWQQWVPTGESLVLASCLESSYIRVEKIVWLRDVGLLVAGNSDVS